MKDLVVVQICCLFIVCAVLFAVVLEQWKKEDDYMYDILELFSEETPQPPKANVALALLMRRPIDLPIWFKHHRRMGVSHFFIRLEDSPGWEDYLASQNDVTFEISSSDKSGNNYETLMYRQLEFVNKSMNKAREMGIDWVFHIDSDELIHGSLSILDDLEEKYKCIRLQNAEAVFKEDEDTCFSAVRFLKCSERAPCRSYINGKGGGRVVEGVSLLGPHHFGYKGAVDGENVYEAPFKRLHVLHFDACSFGAWAEKFQHLSKNKKENVPFHYYKESIDAAVQAYDVYKKHNMSSVDGIAEEMVYNLDGPVYG